MISDIIGEKLERFLDVKKVWIWKKDQKHYHINCFLTIEDAMDFCGSKRKSDFIQVPPDDKNRSFTLHAPAYVEVNLEGFLDE